jgi:hypothetical protein
MVSNQHIRQKKRRKKFLDVKLLNTNRTTVQGQKVKNAKHIVDCIFC